MSMTEMLRNDHGAIAFEHEEQALKAQQVLRFIYNLPIELDKGIRKDKPCYFLRFDTSAKEKVLKLDREISAICQVIQYFKVGELFPTQMYMNDSAFPDGS